MATLSLKNVNKIYENGEKAILDCTFTVRDNELIVVVGPEGSGKSTIVRMIAGLDQPTEGDIFLGGKSVKDVPPKDRDIAMISQSNAINPSLTVYENLAFGLKLRKANEEEIDSKVKSVAALFGLTEVLSKKPKNLSAVEKQRLIIGRAVAREPKLFLFDEPLSNFDRKLRMHLRTELLKLQARIKTPYVYATADQIEAMSLATRLVVMKDGFIQQIDTPQNIYNYPVNLFVADYFCIPSLNTFYGVTLFSAEDKVFASLPGGATIALPGTLLARIKDLPSFVDTGRKVTLCIRPEDLHDEQRFVSASPETVVHMKIDTVEKAGVFTNLYGNFETEEEIPLTENLVAQVDPRSTAQRGDTIEIAFDAKRILLFDENEMSILSRDEFYQSVPENAESSFVPLTPMEMIEKKKPVKKTKKK